MDLNPIPIISDAIEQLIKGPSWLLVCVFLVALGYLLKTIPKFPNQLIPLVCVVAGTILLPLLADPKTLPPAQRHPTLMLCVMGFILGIGAWGCHGIILKRIEKKLGWFQDQPNDQEKKP